MPRPTTPLASVTRRAAAARAGFAAQYGDAAGVVAYAPGRVNLIGDHTDYNDGFALPMTIDRGLATAARPRSDGVVRAHAAQANSGAGEAARYALGESVPSEAPLWARYVFGVANELVEADLLSRGADLYLDGDVPVGAGLSSSAALTMSVGLAFQGAYGFDLAPTDLALLGQRVEHRYVGVQCGIMDQLAIRAGRAGHALLLDCRSLAFEPVPMPFGTAPRASESEASGAEEGVAVVIVNSGVGRSLAGSAYNKRRRTCEAAVEALAQAGLRAPSGARPTALRDVTPDALEAHRAALTATQHRRARHVVGENARVQAAAAALRAGRLDEVGRLMTASHASLRDDYEVSGAELDTLVDLALKAGALGARLTGAGFGGCTVQLVPADAADAFAETVRARYGAATGRDAEAFVVRANAEAGVVRSEG